MKVGDYYFPNFTLPPDAGDIGFQGRRRREFLREHRPIGFNQRVLSGELFKYTNFCLSQPIDRKPLRAEKTPLKQEVESPRPDVDAVQAELDELKTVRYCVRKVIPDALSSRTESGAPPIRNTTEESQNQNELNELLEGTVKQVVDPKLTVPLNNQRQRHQTL